MKKLWQRVREFFRFGRNAEQKSQKETFHSNQMESLEGEVVEPEERQARREVGKMLQLRSRDNGDAEDKYEQYRGTPLMQAIAPSGVWIVIKFSDALEAGGVSDDFKEALIVKARSGEAAIKTVYTADLKKHGSAADLLKAKSEDGRYVALDFYTGHRVEALVTGEWQAELEVAR
jgi:hypothetical protein